MCRISEIFSEIFNICSIDWEFAVTEIFSLPLKYPFKTDETATIKTDETGKAISELLPYGKYYLKELDTGSVYYLLNEDTFEFEIVNDGETVPVTIDNDDYETLDIEDPLVWLYLAPKENKGLINEDFLEFFTI